MTQKTDGSGRWERSEGDVGGKLKTDHGSKHGAERWNKKARKRSALEKAWAGREEWHRSQRDRRDGDDEDEPAGDGPGSVLAA